MDTAAPDGSPPTDTGGTDAFRPTSPLVDPMCTDGMYTETIPDVNAPIDDIAFSGDVSAYVDELLARRYPVGGLLVEGGRTNTRFGPTPCDILFAGSPSSAEDVIGRLNVIVHECGHFFDLGLSERTTSVYVMTESLRLTCERGDSEARGGDTFERSRLTTDMYSPMRPPCGDARPRPPGCDFYSDTYLDGDPDDEVFDGGDQGFSLLFEEAVQYVHSLATEWAVVDQMAPGRRTTARDGILTFLWYIERYLRMARLDYPDAYARITDPCWRDAILTLWGRAWFYLDLTEGIDALAIDNAALTALVETPELVEEIQRLRELECP